MSPVAFVGGVRGRSRIWSCGIVVIVSGVRVVVSGRKECHRIGAMSPVVFVRFVKGGSRSSGIIKIVSGERVIVRSVTIV
jgi:hypothetical protein